MLFIFFIICSKQIKYGLGSLFGISICFRFALSWHEQLLHSLML